jgi:hypothetical protein
MTREAKQRGSRVDRLVLWCLGAATVLTVVAVALLNPSVFVQRHGVRAVDAAVGDVRPVHRARPGSVSH